MEIEKAKKVQELVEQMHKYEEIREFAKLEESVLRLEDFRFGTSKHYNLVDKNDVFKKAIIKTLENEINDIKNKIEEL